MTTARIAALLTLGLSIPVHAQVANSGFNGTVLDEQGRPLAAVSVTYYRLPRLIIPNKRTGTQLTVAPGEPRAGGTVTSSQDGKYEASGLPAGMYRICVGTPSDAYVSPCIWSDGKQIIVLPSGANIAVKTVTVHPSVKVHFTINDPQRLLPTVSELSGVVSIGVRATRGEFEPAIVQSQDQSGLQAVVTVPRGTTVPVWFSARGLKFRDENGKAMGLGARAVISPSADATFSWSVTH